MEKKQTNREGVPPTPTILRQEEGPSTEEQMLPASAVAELLRLANPNVDWGTAIAALGITKKKTTSTDVPPKVTAPAPITTSHTPTEDPVLEPIPQAEPLNSKPSSPKIAETSEIPLDVSPVSAYEPPTVKALREEGERVLETEERADEGVVEGSRGVEGEPTGVVEGVTGDERGEGEKGEKEKRGEEVDAEKEVEEERKVPEGRDVEAEDVVNKGQDPEFVEKEKLMTDEEFEKLLDEV